jgi:hypothetical protein
MKIAITVDNTYSRLLSEQPTLTNEIEKAAAVVLQNAEQRKIREQMYTDADTHNGYLADTTGNPEPVKTAQPEELQQRIAAARTDDADLYTQFRK